MQIKKFNRSYFQYLIPQRTRLKTEYGLDSASTDEEIVKALTRMVDIDYNMIKSYLPGKIDDVLDIGCGLGLIDFAIYNHYNGNCNLHLLDKTNTIDENTSVRGFNEKYIFYNSLESTKDVLISNGVDVHRINTYEVSENTLGNLMHKEFDIIISLLSCGWHYPIETYIDLINKSLKSEGILILDIRHDTGQLEYAKHCFNLINTIVNTAESKHTGGTIGDRYIFKKK